MQDYQVSNEDYIKDFPNIDGKKDYLLKIMAKYGDNKWWLSKDLAVAAYFQSKEELLFINLFDFLEGLDILIGRRIAPERLGWEDVKKLNNDIEIGWNRYKEENSYDLSEL